VGRSFRRGRSPSGRRSPPGRSSSGRCRPRRGAWPGTGGRGAPSVRTAQPFRARRPAGYRTRPPRTYATTHTRRVDPSGRGHVFDPSSGARTTLTVEDRSRLNLGTIGRVERLPGKCVDYPHAFLLDRLSKRREIVGFRTSVISRQVHNAVPVRLPDPDDRAPRPSPARPRLRWLPRAHRSREPLPTPCARSPDHASSARSRRWGISSIDARARTGAGPRGRSAVRAADHPSAARAGSPARWTARAIPPRSSARFSSVPVVTVTARATPGWA
jgi:hypothetical protein